MSFNITHIANREVPVVEKAFVNGEYNSVAPVLGLKSLWKKNLENSPRRMDYYNQHMYFGDTSGNVKKLSTEDGTEVFNHTIHSGTVAAVVVDKGSTEYLISCGFTDKLVKLTRPDGTNIWTFSGHTDAVNMVQFDQVSRNVYSCSSDGTVKRINSTGTEVWSFLTNAGIVMDIISIESYIYAITDNGWLIKVAKADGSEVWRTRVDTGKARSVCGFGGNIYVGGTNDVYKLDTDGNVVWSFVPATNYELILEIDYDENGNEVVCTSTLGYVFRLTSDGKEVLAKRVDEGSCRGLTLDTNGYIYTASDSSGITKLDRYLRIEGYKQV